MGYLSSDFAEPDLVEPDLAKPDFAESGFSLAATAYSFARQSASGLTSVPESVRPVVRCLGSMRGSKQIQP
jgi:hypothetical protein